MPNESTYSPETRQALEERALAERALAETPLPSSFDGNEDFYKTDNVQKIMAKIKREPLIPFGCALTVAAFVNAYSAMRKGDHNRVQRMFRARIIAQAFTVAAMVVGGIYFGNERHKERELWKVQQAQKEEEKRMKWIHELEARDAEDKALQARLARRRERIAEKRDADQKAAAAADGKPEGGQSVMAALGGLFSKNAAVSGESETPEAKK